ncbi:MAG: hypothetical protein KAU27_05635, partial [Desulfuromonadales bacterium]|nr:hypothetical protein [Desulfuromonadales bacterium]
GEAGWLKEDAEAYLHCCDVPDKQVFSATMSHKAYRHGVPLLPDECHTMAHDDCIEVGGRNWRIITGGGHSPQHAALYCDGILISGDQVLPEISSNVSVWPNDPDDDPLALYLASFVALRCLPMETLVLPSHGMAFSGLHRRLDALAAHHHQRLSLLPEACDEPRSVAELLPVLFPQSLDNQQMPFAVGELVAHLNYLRLRGLLKRETSADGRWRYTK